MEFSSVNNRKFTTNKLWGKEESNYFLVFDLLKNHLVKENLTEIILISCVLYFSVPFSDRKKSFLLIQSTSCITVILIILPGYENCCYKPNLFMHSLFSILSYWILSCVFTDCVIVYYLNLSLLTHKDSRRCLGK